jgi:uncharacterized protein YmfQ (DUF2313 family)
MAFNRKYFNLFKNLLPKSDAFSIIIQKYLTKFFESLTCIPDDFRTFIDNIFVDIFPSTTRSIELWENQFGVRVPSSDTSIRRSTVSVAWGLKGGQSAYYLQSKLQEAGFDVQVHENNPSVDPDIFLSSQFIMTCDNSWAVCGNDDAFCGMTGGYVLANGYIAASSDLRDYLAVCGDAFCGYGLSVCGYFEEYIINPKTFIPPEDSDYWNFIFFIGGDAERDPVTHQLTSIATVILPASRQLEFENLILRIKPVNTWAGMIIEYV